MQAHKSKARNIALTHMGGEVFTVAEEPSDMAVLWAELFGGKERKFLRELLTSELVCFTLQDTYQIFVRTLFHSQAAVSSKPGSGMRRDGKFVLMLHSLDGDLTSSWVWSKFIRPMYRNNFSVVLVDLPGFGKSTVSRQSYCPVSKWRQYDHHIISKILEELGIPKCHVCAVGTGCGILMSMLQRARHRLEDEHFMLNPELNRDELFAHVGVGPEPGASAGWREQMREKQQKALVDLMRQTGVKFWIAFDRGVSYGTDDGRINDKRHGNWKRQYDTHMMFTTAVENTFVAKKTVITEVMRADICDAQLGVKVQVRALIPSRNLKASIAKYFSKQNNAKWAAHFVPSHKQQINTSWHAAKEKARAVALGEDEDYSDSDEGTSRPSMLALDNSAAGHSHKAALSSQRALALMPAGAESHHIGAECLNPLSDTSEVSPEFLRAKRALEDRLNGTGGRPISGTRKSLFHSTSDSGLGSSKGESALLSGANFARRLLRSRGARPETGQPLPLESKKENIDWTHAPFEHDLSYGVRNSFMLAFENSVQTFKEEEEGRVAQSRAFKVRTALKQGRTSATLFG